MREKDVEIDHYAHFIGFQMGAADHVIEVGGRSSEAVYQEALHIFLPLLEKSPVVTERITVPAAP